MYVGPYTIALITVGAALLGALITQLLSYRFALDLARRNSKRVAGMRLRETFGLELAILRNTKDNFLKVADIIKARLIDQQMAVDEFRLFLTDEELTAFSKLWNEYYQQKYQGIELPMYREWKYISEPSARNKAIKLIEDIIAFTEPEKDYLFRNLFKKRQK